MRALIRRIDWMKVLDILGWLGFIYLVIYGFLRVFGIIHSPLIINTAMISIAFVAFFAGRYAAELEFVGRTASER